MSATLKTNLNRTVLLERDGDSGIVIKRFHSPGALRRLTDGRRAAREFKILSQLHELGLPVPRPLEIRKQGDHWEVLIQWLPGSYAIEDFLRGERELPVGTGDLPRKLANLLARIWNAGLVHSDLHAGNVLLDEMGKLWIIDFQHARFRSEISTRRRIRDLIVLAAGVRETCSPRFRAKFLIELLRQLDTEESEDRTILAKRIEDEARLHHRYRVRRRQLRWTRESGACRAFAAGPVTGWVSREIEASRAPELCKLALLEFDETATILANGFESFEVQQAGETWLLIRAQDESTLREAWYTSVRIKDHGLAAPRPILLVEQPQPRMLLSENTEPGPGADGPGDNRENRAASIMQLLGSLHDRGLALADLSADTFRLAAEVPSFGAPIEVVAASASYRARDRKAALELVGAQDDQWQQAYCSAWRGDRSELIELREELARD